MYNFNKDDIGVRPSLKYDIIKWKHFRVVGPLSQRPVTRSFDVFFDLIFDWNKQSGKESKFLVIWYTSL